MQTVHRILKKIAHNSPNMPFQVKNSFFSGMGLVSSSTPSPRGHHFSLQLTVLSSALLPAEFQPDLATHCLILVVSFWGEAIP